MKYKAGIIGCGRTASTFEDESTRQKPSTHAGVYTECEQTELVAASDINSQRLKKFSERWNVTKTYLDYKEMLEKESLDILSVCTHAPSHREIVVNAAAAGVQAIFCEKPISTSLREADEMIDVCRKKGTLLIINHTRRWDAYFNIIKEMIDYGEIGVVESLICHSAAGLLNNGTQIFDLLRYYAGDASWLTGRINYDDSTDPNGMGMMQLKNGAYAFVDSGFREYMLHGINIIGKKGMIRGTGGLTVDRDFEVLKIGEIKSDTTVKIPEQSMKKPMLRKLDFRLGKSPISVALEDIVHCLDYSTKPRCTGEDGRAALEMALAFFESDRHDGKKITFPMENRDLRVIPRETGYTKDGTIGGAA
jgi:predicted dehydrogenase